MTIKEQIGELRPGQRIEAVIIGNKLGLKYIGTFSFSTNLYFYMLDDEYKQVTIPLEFLEEVKKVE